MLEESRLSAGGGAGVLSLLEGPLVFAVAADFAFSFPLPKKSFAEEDV